MRKKFNVTGICVPGQDYMVNTDSRVEEIVKNFIEEGQYFTICKARQFGKTTLLYMLERRLKGEYIVLSLSFEAADDMFTSLYAFAMGFVRRIARELERQGAEENMLLEWRSPVSESFPLDDLGDKITRLCRKCGRKILVMIDEVDKSSDNQIFLSFLGMLREKYLNQKMGKDLTFQSVILAGVYDVKNLKLKLHPGQEPKYNSPWNIAADFTVDMNFSAHDIAGMLEEYERDYRTGMNVPYISSRIFEYTSGYPYLVSRLCKLLDEQVAGTAEFPERAEAWNERGFQAAIKLLEYDTNTLYDDMVKKLDEYPALRKLLESILFNGKALLYNQLNDVYHVGLMFGFLKRQKDRIVIANRIFETVLYNLFLSEEMTDSLIYNEALKDKNQFIVNGRLDMDRVLEKFQQHFTEIYAAHDEKFIEAQGRKLFLLYIKPIINGSGNYYCEASTRDMKRTDLVIDYRGEQTVVEMKIWHGEEYNRRGEEQLFGYLEEYHLQKGYLLSFNFNKKKKTGIQRLEYKGKTLVEVVV